jgi:defect-in-organelle-trafficking protein DotD
MNEKFQLHKNHIKVLVVSLAFLLTGCANESKKVVDLNLRYVTSNSTPINSSDGAAQAQLSQAATSIGHSLQELSAIQIATHPGVAMPSPANAETNGMGKVASLNWTGPVEGVVKEIAAESGYTVHILGDTPAIVPIVVLSARHQTLATILRNVQYQVAGKADIRTYPQSGVIELRYRSNL